MWLDLQSWAQSHYHRYTQSPLRLGSSQAECDILRLTDVNICDEWLNAQTNDTTGVNCWASIEATSRKHKPHQLNKANRGPGDVRHVRNEARRKPKEVGGETSYDWCACVRAHVSEVREVMHTQHRAVTQVFQVIKCGGGSPCKIQHMAEFSSWLCSLNLSWRGATHTHAGARTHKILDIWSKAVPEVGTCIQPHAQTHFSPACKRSAASPAAM